MRIEIKGRNVSVDEHLREHVQRRFRKVAAQVSELAELEVELFEERNPAIADACVAEATLHLKGVTLRARAASRDLLHSVNEVGEEIAVQVKRHRDKRRKRREARAAAAAPGELGAAAAAVSAETAAAVSAGAAPPKEELGALAPPGAAVGGTMPGDLGTAA